MRSLKYIVLACAPFLMATADAHSSGASMGDLADQADKQSLAALDPEYPSYDDWTDAPSPQPLPDVIDDSTDDDDDDFDDNGLTDSVSYHDMELHFDNLTACRIDVPDDAFVDQDINIAVTTNVLGASPSYWLEDFVETEVLNSHTLVFNNIGPDESFMAPTDMANHYTGSFKISPVDRASMETGYHTTKVTLGVNCQ